MEALQEQLQLLLDQNARLQQQLQQQAPPPSPQVLSPAHSVHRVSVKLPVFWPDKPALWFAQAEAQFNIAGITQDSTKYAYVVSQLDSRYAAEVDDIIINPPLQDAYAFLRSELIRRLSLSEEQRVRQLLMEEELGERKPSQFLRHLRSLAGATQVSDNLLRQLWLQRLPAQVQAILQTQAEIPLDRVAALADKIMEVTPPPAPPIHSPAPVHAITSTPPEIAAINKRLDELAQQMASLQTSFRSRPRSPGRSDHSRNHSRSESSHSPGGVCWYHRRFREQAKKCNSPCTFSTNSNGSQ